MFADPLVAVTVAPDTERPVQDRAPYRRLLEEMRSVPKPRTFLTARWQSLLMINYAVQPAVLERYLPRGVEIDFFEGRTFVSLVGFLFLDTRLLGVPVPLHRDFEEVNLRFYVRRRVGDEVRRGVVFVKEIVPKAAIAWTARTAYNERYVAMPMRHEVSMERVAYEWRREGAWESISGRPVGAPETAAAGSEEEFITEHYWGYAAQRDGSTVEYRVEHPRWRVQPVEEVRVDLGPAALYGAAFQQVLLQAPTSVFLADGSEVSVLRPTRCRE